MHITFPDDPRIFDGANLLVRFTTRVDGEPVEFAIATEALAAHFCADSALEPAFMVAFDNGRNRIHSACVEALNPTDGKGVVLHSGLFRVERIESDRGAAG
jgi:hypothetical protein